MQMRCTTARRVTREGRHMLFRGQPDKEAYSTMGASNCHFHNCHEQKKGGGVCCDPLDAACLSAYATTCFHEGQRLPASQQQQTGTHFVDQTGGTAHTLGRFRGGTPALLTYAVGDLDANAEAIIPSPCLPAGVLFVGSQSVLPSTYRPVIHST